MNNKLGRALWSGISRIDMTKEGIVIKPLLGKSRAFVFSAISTPVLISSTLLGSRLVVGGEVIAQRLSFAAASDLVEVYRDHRESYWRQKLMPAIEAVNAAMVPFMALQKRNRYLRASELNDAFHDFKLHTFVLTHLDDCALLGLAVPDGASEIKAFLDAPDAWRNTLNDRLLAAQESHFSPLFDSLESHPLTPQQRKACIVDEDNILVLAGAGTGKTSTMMAKATYLVKAGLAKPNEILMLAFAKKAREELEERVYGINGMEGVQVETFHSLGCKIIGAVEGKRMAVSVLAQDDVKRSKFIDEGIEDLQADRRFLHALREFFSNYLLPIPNDLQFKNFGEYLRYLKKHEIRSLNGDVVKSFAELEIANYLYMNGIEYIYENKYEHETANAKHAQYRPDFYLPDLEVYIEHYGVDRGNNTAHGIDKKKYWKDIEWKRELHREHGTSLIETYSYERGEGNLLKVLEERLRTHCEMRGVEFETVIQEKPFDAIRDLGGYKVFSKLLNDFLTVFKGSPWTLRALRNQLDGSWNDARLGVFLHVFEVVRERYEDALEKSKTIDFNDMIKKATAYIENGESKPAYRYIMVDEFQDISPARAALVKVLRDKVPGCALFCVGDDWQAIYRFTGSDVTLTTKFQEHFGYTERVDLDKTFRFNNRISDVASRFVQENPGQLRKAMCTHANSERTEICIISKLNRDAALQQALEEVTKRAAGNRVSVYLLARFNDSKPDDLKKLQQEYPSLEIEFHSAHRSKGLEADYVILLDVIEGKKGFPSMMETDPIIERILPTLETFKFAEERRLFYVAITRARNSVWLLTQPGKESLFINELTKDGYDVNLDRDQLAEAIISTVRCPTCLDGVLERRQGKYTDFYGCSLYPYCDGKAETCPVCHKAPITTDGHHHHCANPDCDFEAETCTECGTGYMKLITKGPYGPFYGCSNWRGDMRTSCTRKRPVKQK
ncbi:MAG: UvrD-helicase domain-containing protein [Candidatus Thiodiazotropha sp. (ex Dulcina madagascariensis)]|nr:UvrD-helicase domain-containing protein [Candidatus Thiodiazotropha sp. (ex Dulcina madagascariensis)]